MRLKMRHAAECLAAGQAVADTASACGYGDADVFSKAFRRHFGLPPTRWQAQSG
ncbi:MAG: helix-turn-helix domain-containing protein [Planctomycetota bacterium]